MRCLLCCVATLTISCSSSPDGPVATVPAQPGITPPLQPRVQAPTPAAGEVPVPTPTVSPARCPLVPLRLMADPTDDGGLLRIAANGRMGGALMMLKQPPALRAPEFDPRGCIFDQHGVIVELTTDGALWTTTEVLPAHDRVVGRYQIGADGRVFPQASHDATLRVVGFEERGLCAAKLLVGMRESIMARVRYGARAPIDPPATSVCADRHRPRR